MPLFAILLNEYKTTEFHDENRKRRRKERIFSPQSCKNHSDAHEGATDIDGEGRK